MRTLKEVGPVVLILGSVSILFLILPLVAVGLSSFSSSRYLEFPPPGFSVQWYQSLVEDSSWSVSCILSAQVAFVVATVSTIAGGLGALGFVKSQSRFKGLLLFAAVCPLIIPGVVLAVGYYLVVANLGILESRTAIILAHLSFGLPVALVTVLAALKSRSSLPESAARTLGAGELLTTWRVTIPSIRRALAASFLLVFVMSFDEPVMCLFLGGSSTITLPKRIWDGIQYEIDPTAAAAATVLIALSAAIVLVAEWLVGISD